MRLGFISDIHGNFHALEVVLDDLKQRSIDQIICLGDIASLGPQPREVIQTLRELDLTVIKGNHDHYLLNPSLTQNHHPWLRAAEQWCLSQLSQADFDYLHSFKDTLELTSESGTQILCFHGSPRAYEEFLYPDTSSETLSEIFDDLPATVLVGGHTHVQLVRRHKEKLLINPGSVGLPLLYPQQGPNQQPHCWAEYAILDIIGNLPTVSLHRVPIDFEKIVTAARGSGLPDTEFWLSSWLV